MVLSGAPGTKSQIRPQHGPRRQFGQHGKYTAKKKVAQSAQNEWVSLNSTQLGETIESQQRTQRYLNVTDEEMRRGVEVSWKNGGRPLRLASGS